MLKLNKHKFSDLYEISSGISTKPEQAGKGYPFASFSTIFNNIFLPDILPDLMDTTKKQREKSSIKEGDILLTRTSETINELAMSCVAIKDYPNATFSGFAKRLRPLQRNITYHKFMAFYLRAPYFRKLIDSNTIMTLRASFNEKIFKFLYLYLPDFEKQVIIGDFLWNIEKKLQTNNQIIRELREVSKLIFEYWFVQFDYPNQEGKPYKSNGGRMVHADLLNRDIPYGWEIKNN